MGHMPEVDLYSMAFREKALAPRGSGVPPSWSSGVPLWPHHVPVATASVWEDSQPIFFMVPALTSAVTGVPPPIGWEVTNQTVISYFMYPFTCWWPLGLFPVLEYHEYSWKEHAQVVLWTNVFSLENYIGEIWPGHAVSEYWIYKLLPNTFSRWW